VNRAPYFSIVTISFNQRRYLRAAIESVLSQDFNDFEYLMVDPGSSDGSRDVIAEYSRNFAATILEPDDGPADGLNRGFQRARGGVYYYLNADDVLLPGALSRAHRWFESYVNADVIYGHGKELDSEGRTRRNLYSTRWSLRGYSLGASTIIQQGTFLRRHAFIAAGGFNVANKTCWDAELLIDLALAGARFHRVSDFFGGFRIYDESNTGSGRHRHMSDDYSRMFAKITGHSPNRADRAMQRLFGRPLRWLLNPVVAAHGAVARARHFVGSS
jgi:glycosyltransferase involved in cell wall biosynthesis